MLLILRFFKAKLFLAWMAVRSAGERDPTAPASASCQGTGLDLVPVTSTHGLSRDCGMVLLLPVLTYAGMDACLVQSYVQSRLWGRPLVMVYLAGL